MDICMLCKSSKKDDIRYGDFLKKGQFGVHTFCLYLSSSLHQCGGDNEGFLGFLLRDIKAEIRRCSSLKCCYCNKKHANIGCCDAKCRKSFHLICGLENKVENTFCDDFRSFCHKHVTKVAERPASTENCLICFDSLFASGEKFNGIDVILTPCCRNGWFHRFCLLKFAKTAGYFFKCPLCNDSKVFREELPAKGIYIPNQDAAWELEPNAFAELLERPSICAAQQCTNRKGRTVQSPHNPFVICYTCGSTAVHKYCLPDADTRFNCADCSVAVEERDSGHESLNSQNNQIDEEYIDVCHVSEKEDIVTNSKIAECKKNVSTQYDAKISEAYTMKNNEEQKLCSDTDSDDIKPCVSKQTARLRLKSESSEISEKATTSRSKSCCGIREFTAFGNQETVHTRQQRTLTTNNKEHKLCCDTDDDDIKPCVSKQTARLRLESGSSETSQEATSSSYKTRLRTRKDTAFSDEESPRTKKKCRYTKGYYKQISSSDDDNANIKPCGSKPTARLRLESDCSVTSQKTEDSRNKTGLCGCEPENSSCKEILNRRKLHKRNVPTIDLSDSDDSELEEKTPSQLSIKSTENKPQNSSCSGQKVSMGSDRKRKASLILFDSEDEMPSPKQKCLIRESISKDAHNTTQYAFNKLYESFDDTDSDNDPLEICCEMLMQYNRPPKQTTTIFTDKQQTKNEQSATGNNFKLAENEFADLEEKQSTSKKLHNSAQQKCYSGVSNNNVTKKKQTENPLNVSCIALRTRRKTICGQTDFDKQKHEMSEMYGTNHDSNESLDYLTDLGSSSRQNFVYSDPDNLKVDDGFRKSDSTFDISCIANRTRRRKSLKCQRLPPRQQRVCGSAV